MTTLGWILLGVLAVFVLFVLYLIIKASAFKPKKYDIPESDELDIDRDKAINGLAEMIKCRTISSRNKALEDEKEFEKFRDLLVELFPEVHKVMDRKLIGDRGILYLWKGKSSAHPSVFMSHYDVVSVSEEGWTHPAFDAYIENGEMWGRGTIDTKITLNGIMQSAERLIKKGFVPENDVYLSFAGDEEIIGTGASKIVDYLESQGVVPELVIDEGGALVNKVFPGVKKTAALIGVAEKGMTDIELSVKGMGGHASSPPPHTAVGKLSSACVQIENSPMKSKLGVASKGLFMTMARNSGFLYKLIFANLWVFKPLFDMICKKSGGEMNALMRTTVAFTQMEGSKGANVLASEAKMVANVRIIEGDTLEDVEKHFKKTIKDKDVQVRIIHGNNPSPSSSPKTEAYKRVQDSILETWGDVIVSPYLMVACSDSRHYCRISKNVLRFSAMELTNEQRALIHGHNERIELDKIVKSVEFFSRLMMKC